MFILEKFWQSNVVPWDRIDLEKEHNISLGLPNPEISVARDEQKKQNTVLVTSHAQMFLFHVKIDGENRYIGTGETKNNSTIIQE